MKKFIQLFVILLLFNNNKLILANQNPSLNTNSRAAIPNILNEKDKKLYLEINKLQSNGNWKDSNIKIKLLSNKILLGYLEYDKLMHPNKYKSSYIELADWLQNYPDFPVVMQRRVYKLMMRRKSQENKKETLQKPKYGNYLRGYGESKKYYILL